MNTTKSKSGFTIIEVVLVLAIAALIFLIVFLAVPALQKSQRDTARKNDMSRLVAATQSYQSNNRGAIPFASSAPVTGFIDNYLQKDSSFTDPSGGDYSFVTNAPSNPTDGKIQIGQGKKCSATGTLEDAGTKSVAFIMLLEGGGTYCQNN